MDNRLMGGQKTEDSNIFLWGHFRKILEPLDSERYLAICQNSPKRYLVQIYNKNIEKYINDLFFIKEQTDLPVILKKELFIETYIKIEQENYLHNFFNQVSQFMRMGGDMVSIGSFLTGELKKSKNKGKLVYGEVEEND